MERELEAAVNRMRGEGPSDNDHYEALSRAYPNPPEGVRGMIARWAEDERNSGGVPPLDLLLDSLQTLHKLMRLAHEDGEDWLTEILEYQRQETAARAACASGDRGLRPFSCRHAKNRNGFVTRSLSRIATIEVDRAGTITPLLKAQPGSPLRRPAGVLRGSTGKGQTPIRT